MPRCLTCHTRLYGSGLYCALHNPRTRRSHTQEHYNFNTDSSFPVETHFRTSTGTTGTIARRQTQHSDHHDTPGQLALYNQPQTDTQLVALPLLQAFSRMQDAYMVASITYDDRGVTVSANLEREQCGVCRAWFPTHEKLAWHREENPVSCEAHGVCMRREDAVWHGTERRHERCFVRDCVDVFRAEGGWRTSAVARHVKDWHSYAQARELYY